VNILPLQSDPNPLLALGDIVTFEGYYNRPATFSRAWWKLLIFGRLAGFHFVGLHPHIHKVCTRRDLFEPRALQKYRIDRHGSST
jgi:hypothetical protein